jgi:hypothetical protein
MVRDAINPLSSLSKSSQRHKSTSLSSVGGQNKLPGSKGFKQFWTDFARKPKGFGRFNRRKGGQSKAPPKGSQEEATPEDDPKGTSPNMGFEDLKGKFNKEDLLNSKAFKEFQNPNFLQANKWWFIFGAALISSYLLLKQVTKVPTVDMKYLELESFMKRGRVKSVKIQAVTNKMQKRYIAHVDIQMGNGEEITTRYIAVYSPDDFVASMPNDVPVELLHSKSTSDFFSENVGILNDVASIAFYGWLAFGVYKFNKKGGMSQFTNMMDIGKSKAKKFDGEMMKIKFKDVAGCLEAK